jgi:hypothetical protein
MFSALETKGPPIEIRQLRIDYYRIDETTVLLKSFNKE